MEHIEHKTIIIYILQQNLLITGNDQNVAVSKRHISLPQNMLH